LWLEAHRKIEAMRIYWPPFSEIRNLLNALIHASPLSLRFSSERHANDANAHARAVRRGIALALPLAAFAVWTASKGFTPDDDTSRKTSEAWVAEARRTAGIIWAERRLLPASTRGMAAH